MVGATTVLAAVLMSRGTVEAATQPMTLGLCTLTLRNGWLVCQGTRTISTPGTNVRLMVGDQVKTSSDWDAFNCQTVEDPYGHAEIYKSSTVVMGTSDASEIDYTLVSGRIIVEEGFATFTGSSNLVTPRKRKVTCAGVSASSQAGTLRLMDNCNQPVGVFQVSFDGGLVTVTAKGSAVSVLDADGNATTLAACESKSYTPAPQFRHTLQVSATH